MKQVYFVFLILMMSSIGIVIAEDFSNFSFKQMECMSILPFKNEIVGQSIPDQIPVSNEIINLYIAGENYGYIQIDNKTITEMNCSENEDATYDILISSEKTLSDIYSAEDKMDMVIQKFNDKEIQLKGKTFGKKIKAFFLKIGIKWFG